MLVKTYPAAHSVVFRSSWVARTVALPEAYET